MQRTLARCALIALALNASTGLAATHPVFDQLKSFRSYLSVTSLTGEQHYFVAWISDVAPVVCQIAGNTEAEIAALTEDQMGCTWGGIVPPAPSAIAPVPPGLGHLAAAARARVAAAYPAHRKLQIEYAGSFRVMGLKEVVPGTVVTNPHSTFREVNAAEMSVKVDMKARTLETFGFSIMGSYSGLCRNWDPNDCQTAPDFVDFTPPASEEGTLISARYFDGKLPKPVADSFVDAVFATIAAKDAGTYANPIQSIFARQGASELPPGFNQRLVFKFDLYGRTANWADQVGAHARLEFLSNDLFAGPVTVSQKFPELGGFEVIATADLLTRKMKVRMVAPTGEEHVAELEIEPTILGSGSERALSIATPLKESGATDAKFNGYGQFTGVDAYPRGTLMYDAMSRP